MVTNGSSATMSSTSNLNTSNTLGTKNVTLSGRPLTSQLSQCNTTEPTIQGPTQVWITTQTRTGFCKRITGCEVGVDW